MNNNQTPVSSKIYDEEYYLANCDGFNLFDKFEGQKLSARLEYAWRIANVQPGMTMLDIGVGRGETVYQGYKVCAKTFGIDFSIASVKIAQSVISNQRLPGSLVQADAKHIPFQDEIFDRVLMFDIVEHLYDWELEKVYREAWRLLKPGGQIIIHTAPNLWYYQFGYPLYRIIESLRGKKLPANPRDRFRFHKTHVNEQSILTLRKDLKKSGFQVRTWLVHIPKEGVSPPWLIQLVSPILYNLPPLLWIFRNDVFAVAIKEINENSVYIQPVKQKLD